MGSTTFTTPQPYSSLFRHARSAFFSLVPGTLVLVALFSAVGPALAEREVLEKKDGITVEEQPEPGRTLPILFGTTTIAAPPERIAKWIEAVDTFPEWQHNCEEARSLPQPDGRGRP